MLPSSNSVGISFKGAVFAVVLVVLMAIPAHGIKLDPFDGNRKGFTFGWGAGPCLSTIWSRTDLYVGSNKTRLSDGKISKAGINLEWRLGAGYNEKLQFYFMDRTSIFDPPKMFDDYGNYFDKMDEGGMASVFYTLVSPLVLPFIPLMSSHTTFGVGASYFLEETAPTFFIDGGFGLAVFHNPIADEVMGGGGFFLGAGYEYTEHWFVKLDMTGGFRRPPR